MGAVPNVKRGGAGQSGLKRCGSFDGPEPEVARRAMTGEAVTEEMAGGDGSGLVLTGIVVEAGGPPFVVVETAAWGIGYF